MLPFKRILFATDFSPACEAVVPYVMELKDRYDAELSILHVSNIAPVVYGEYAAFAAENMPLYAEVRKKACADLRRFVSERFAEDHPNVFLEDGEVGSVIEKVVKRERVDLVMMPTHGRGAVRRLLLGSVTSKVLHDTCCAVWTGVHHEEPDHCPHIPYHSIVCAVNLDKEAPALLTAADSLARKYRASLTIAHIAELPPNNYAVDAGPYRKAVLDYTETELRQLRDELAIEAKTEVFAGPAAAGIREIAIHRRADLLVVGRGQMHGTVKRLWSNLYSIIRESPCPVLSV